MNDNQRLNHINAELLQEIATTRMPFGKYKERLICDLPERYLIWFQQKGVPEGKLGMLLSSMYVIKLNGLEYLLKPLRK